MFTSLTQDRPAARAENNRSAEPFKAEITTRTNGITGRPVLGGGTLGALGAEGVEGVEGVLVAGGAVRVGVMGPIL